MQRASQAPPRLPTSRLKVGKPHITYMREKPFLDDREELTVWVQIRLDRDWVAAYKLGSEDGRHVIAEVRLMPFDPDNVAAGGITSKALDQLRTDEVFRAVRDFLEWVIDQGGSWSLEKHLPDFKIDLLRITEAPTNRRRRATEDLELAGQAYASAPHGQKRQAVANAMSCSLSNADKWIRRAKDHGYA